MTRSSSPVCGILNNPKCSGELKVNFAIPGINVVASKIIQVPFVQRHRIPVPTSEETRGCYVSSAQIMDHDGDIFSSNIQYFLGRASRVIEWIKTQGNRIHCGRMATLRIPIHQFSCHGKFCLGCFGQGNSDGIAQAVFQQCSDSNRAFDSAVFSISRFGNTQVKRIIHAFCIHASDKKAVGLDHDLRIGGLHADHDFVVVMFSANSEKFQGTFHHARGSVSVAAENAIRK